MATGPVVDQLAAEYAAAGQPVVFLEQNVDSPLGSRKDRWWAAHGSGGVVSLPLIMVSSGHQISNGYLGASAHDTYKAMVDSELARPAQAEITATSTRTGNKVRFQIQLKNLAGVSLSSGNAATVHAIVYEEHVPVDPYTDHITGRIVRAAQASSITSTLANGATANFMLETADLTNVVDWNKIHAIVLADYRPGGTTGAYDMLQTVPADPQPTLSVTQQASADVVRPGAHITYSIRVVNNGLVDLHAMVTDTLPAHTTPGGILTWTPVITAPGGIWSHSVVVTTEMGYNGALTNTVQVTTAEGETGQATSRVYAFNYSTYLPLVVK